LRRRHREVLLYTGQHYNYGMSPVPFDGLDIPQPDVNLGIGSASHGRQTGEMLIGIEAVLLRERPDWMLVYGDTNSTLAGANRDKIVAAVEDLRVPVECPPPFGDGHAAERIVALLD
jgi:UDP-N-acetylglucosamine 2-epimerase